jgi:hypothetical protein
MTKHSVFFPETVHFRVTSVTSYRENNNNVAQYASGQKVGKSDTVFTVKASSAAQQKNSKTPSGSVKIA